MEKIRSLIINDPNKKYYFEKVAFNDAKKLCQTLLKAPNTLILKGLNKDKNKDIEETFEIISFDPDTMAINVKSKGNLVTQLTGSDLTGQFVSVKISTANFHLFTTSKLIFNEEIHQYSLTLEAAFFKAQRRSNYRLMASNFVAIQFKINNTEVYDGLDVSATGTSFIVAPDKIALYPQDAEFLLNTLRVNKSHFDIPRCRVTGVWEHLGQNGAPTGSKKIGILFLNLPEQTEATLYQHINNEARAEEMLKKMYEKKKVV